MSETLPSSAEPAPHSSTFSQSLNLLAQCVTKLGAGQRMLKEHFRGTLEPGDYDTDEFVDALEDIRRLWGIRQEQANDINTIEKDLIDGMLTGMVNSRPLTRDKVIQQVTVSDGYETTPEEAFGVLEEAVTKLARVCSS